MNLSSGNSNNKPNKYAFIGAGNMATAYIKGLIDSKTVKEDEITIFDLNVEQYQNYIMYNINIAKDYFMLCNEADFIFIVTKPAYVKNALKMIAESGADIKNSVFISMCASVPTSYIEKNLETGTPVIRMMPSTPMMVGKGAVAITRNQYVSEESFKTIFHLTEKISEIAILPEEKMNAITSVNGSSPAYVYLFIKAILDGADEQGIDKNEILDLVLTTVEGSVKMVRESEKGLDELIKNVAAPNGTTLAALESFEKDDFTGTIKRAMQACTRRADEITKELP